jgi:2,3-bisphosphoglycerate-dependent phosphoglycerate mutase
MVNVVTHLYLIRHGEAVSNVQPIVGGMRGDTGLTPRGVAQAERLRDRLASTGAIAADVLVSSTLPRARETAEIIAPALGLPILWDDDVQEMRPGVADGMSLDEFREKFGIPSTAREPFRPLAPGGENWPQFMLRVATALDRIARQYRDKSVVIVCHGGVIEGSFVYFFGLNSFAGLPVRFNTHNTSITHWTQVSPGDPSARWRLMCYNDDAHLQGLGDPSGRRPGTPLPPPQ